MIPDGVMDEVDYEHEMMDYSTVYDSGPLAGEVK